MAKPKYTPQQVQQAFWAKVDTSGGMFACWNWTAFRFSKGYGKFTVNHKSFRAHRYSWELAFGAIPDNLFVCHSCDNPSCVNPSHLFLGTNKDNLRDMREKGRSAMGEKNGHAKFTDAEIIDIRERYARGDISQSALAREFGTHPMSIYYIVSGKGWKHLP